MYLGTYIVPVFGGQGLALGPQPYTVYLPLLPQASFLRNTTHKQTACPAALLLLSVNKCNQRQSILLRAPDKNQTISRFVFQPGWPSFSCIVTPGFHRVQFGSAALVSPFYCIRPPRALAPTAILSRDFGQVGPAGPALDEKPLLPRDTPASVTCPVSWFADLFRPSSRG